MILAGDVGGTNTRLAFFDLRNGQLEKISERTYPSREHASLDDIVADFVGAQKIRAAAAGIGIAGPVHDGVSHATNLPWIVDARRLGQRVDIPSVSLLNDLEANGYGIATLAPGDFAVLQEGAAGAAGNAVIISPGTGLGEGVLYWDGKQHWPLPSEGGHASFAPEDELQDDLLKYLRTQFGHVSWERLVSGPGLFNIFKFLRDTGNETEPAWLTQELAGKDPARVISKAALEGKSPLCEKALDLFVALLASECGNMALKVLATGGVYMGGGIPPKILPKLKTVLFLKAFANKGRFRTVLEAMPVRVILNEYTALRGAARRAAMLQQAAAG
ncbi:MAG TPA: glucokinase [Candidatus Acidoferrales bacterium]|nr:glucokinase [Candidatus Acidoferrales bacterium]